VFVHGNYFMNVGKYGHMKAFSRRLFLNRKKQFKKIAIIILIIFFVFVIFNLKTNAKGKTVAEKLIAQFVPSPTPTFTPTPTPTPTNTPTPTITPTPTFTGFCVTAPILMYHHVEDMGKANADGHGGLTVSPDFFDSQMGELVSRGYRVISVEELINDLFNNQKPGKVAVVTLDDGYEDNFQNAFQIAKKYGVHLNIMLATGLMENPDFLKWNEISEMKNSGLVSFGNHTWSHFSLPNGDDAKINSEISISQTQIQDHLGFKPIYIAWPWGSYDNRTIAGARANGISAGLSTIPGTIQCDSFLWGLHRTRIGNSSLSAYGL
jgi:peptidoglycan/xylan/chitin deacetylase (PgdA/CDA1 family)